MPVPSNFNNIVAMADWAMAQPLKQQAFQLIGSVLEDFQTMPTSDPRHAILDTVALSAAMGLTVNVAGVGMGT